MKKTLSPITIDIPFVSPLTGETSTQYKLIIRVWDGLEANPPISESYSKTVSNLNSSIGVQKVNISRLVNDFVIIRPSTNTSTGLINGNSQVWVQTSVIYTTTDAADLNLEQNVVKSLAVKGYTYGNEGANQETNANNILIDYDEFNVSRTGIFMLPVFSQTSAITTISYPNNEINFSQTPIATTNSADSVKVMFVDVSETTLDTYIEIVYNGVTTTLNIIDECKYTPIDVVFFNKNGAEQSLTFFKEKTNSLKIKSESFESDREQPSVSGQHQFVRYNTQARGSFKVNSGFVDEGLNETFRQLLLSDVVWIYDQPSFTFTPVNVKTSTFEEKTRRKDRLINYEIEFEYSYNEINNI
tara:strand:- start:110 stop:1180 length:1071 start_codon:yes stop_codon:yes gene_type:complete